MLSKILNPIIVVFIITQFFIPLHAQQKDSLTTNWLLDWDYSDSLIVADSINSFEVYRNTSSNPPTDPIKIITKNVDVQDFNSTSWRDYDIDAGVHYYYWVKAVNGKNVQSDYSNMTDAAVSYVKETMDTIVISADTSIYLDVFVENQKYDSNQYKDSLSWLIKKEGSDVFRISETFNDLTISITENNVANFDIKDDSIQTKTVYFKVYDNSADFILYIKKSVIKYDANFTPQPPDTSHPSDSTEYDPEKETLVYPVPFRASVNDYIVFDNLPPGGSLLIFDVMGGLVFEKSGLTDKQYRWNVKNNSGRNINAGLYIFHVRTKNGSKIDSGKVVIIR